MLYVCVRGVMDVMVSVCIVTPGAVGARVWDYMEEAYSSAGIMTALKVSMSVSFCLPHPVAVSVYIICSGVCACTEMYVLLGCTRACVCRCDGDGDVICVGHDLNWRSGWWYVCSVNVE